MKKNAILGFVLSAIILPVTAQNFSVNKTESTIEWNGEKVTGEHNGNILLKSGEFEIKNNKLTSGTFVMDMSSMTNLDIDDEGTRNKLMGHLKSDDFFGVEKYPTATLEIIESSVFQNGEAEVTGNLTIKANTHPITFKIMRDGNKFSTTLTVDRTLYDVRYGSGKFFENLGDKTIYDEFSLMIELSTIEK